MVWQIEFVDEFSDWWNDLSVSQQESIAAAVTLLEEYGPQLTFPTSSSINSSRHSHMRELRIQHKGSPYRVLYAFDPRRAAILLLGGNKRGDARWYEVNIPIADDRYDEHLNTIKKEGII